MCFILNETLRSKEGKHLIECGVKIRAPFAFPSLSPILIWFR